MNVLHHEETVTSADLSGDGRFAASADRGQTVRLWRLDSPEEPIRVIPLTGAGTHRIASKLGADNPVALSADGSLVACAPAREVPAPYAPDDGKEVLVISMASGEVVRRHAVPSRPIALRFFDDGTLAVALPRAGLHLHPPDGSAPVLIGAKTATCGHIAGTDSLLCVRESTSQARLIWRSGKPKPQTVNAWHADHNGEVLVTAGYEPHFSVKRGKQSTQVPLPGRAVGVAADAQRIVIVTATALLVYSAADLSCRTTIPGDFAGVTHIRLRAGKVLLWTLPQLHEARPSATLIDLDDPEAAARPAPLRHRSKVIDVGFLGDEVVTIDQDGLLLAWRDATPRAVEDAAVPPSWRLRTRGDSRVPGRIRDALQLGDAILVATDAGALHLVDSATAARVPSPELGALHQHLLPLDGTRALAYGNQSTVLVDAAARAVYGRAQGAQRVAVSRDGSFIAGLSHGHVLLHPTWCLPAGEQLVKLAADPLLVDVAFNADDALVLATSEGALRVIDTATLELEAEVHVGKRVRAIAAARDRRDVVAVAYEDGTAAEVKLPVASTPKDPGAVLMDRWNPPLAESVLAEMRRNGFKREERSPEVSTPVGLLRLPRHLHELICWRTDVPLHGNSPDVWAGVGLEAFYGNVFKATKTPRGERLIDLGNIRFHGRAEPFKNPRGPRGVSDPTSALSDPPPELQIATVGNGEVVWTVLVASYDPDPFVSFVHVPTGTRRGIIQLSEILYRLVPDPAAAPEPKP